MKIITYVKSFISTKKGKLIIGSTAAVIIVAGIVTWAVVSSPKSDVVSVSTSSASSSSEPIDMSKYRITDTDTSSSSSASSEDSTIVAKNSSASNSSSGGYSVSLGDSDNSDGKSGYSAGSGGSTNIAVKSVDFNKRKASCTVGDEFTLTASITPANATDKSLKWTTTNSSVATVTQSGVVTAKGTGTAYIRATVSNGQRDTCTVTVTSKSSGNSTGTSGSTVTDAYCGAPVDVKTTSWPFGAKNGDEYENIGFRLKFCDGLVMFYNPSAGCIDFDEVDVFGQDVCSPITVKKSGGATYSGWANSCGIVPDNQPRYDNGLTKPDYGTYTLTIGGHDFTFKITTSGLSK